MGGYYRTHDIQCICGAKGRRSVMGRHQYDRKPRESLPKGWSRWGSQYIYCPDCFPNHKLVDDLGKAKFKLQARGSKGWEVKLCGDGLNLVRETQVLIRVEPKPPAVYVLSQPFDGDVEAAMDSEQVRVWLAENGADPEGGSERTPAGSSEPS